MINILLTVIVGVGSFLYGIGWGLWLLGGYTVQIFSVIAGVYTIISNGIKGYGYTKREIDLLFEYYNAVWFNKYSELYTLNNKYTKSFLSSNYYASTSNKDFVIRCRGTQDNYNDFSID